MGRQKFITDSPVVHFAAILTGAGCKRLGAGLEFALPEQSLPVKLSRRGRRRVRSIVPIGGGRSTVAIECRGGSLSGLSGVPATSSCFAPGGLTCRVRLS